MKAISEIEEVVAKYRQLKDVRKSLADAREMLAADDEMRELAQMEIAELEPQEPRLEQELQVLLQPKDPNDEKNVFVEIRAGTGGDEASLFASEIMRMYIRYAEQKRWKVDVTDANYSSVNGIKDATLQIEGQPRLLAPEVRVGRPPRAARPADRDAGTHPHLRDHGRRASGSGRHRHRQVNEKDLRIDTLLLLGPRRPVGQHDLLGRAHDAHPDRRRRLVSGREVADQEPREGAQGPEGAALRHRAPEARGRALRHRAKG